MDLESILSELAYKMTGKRTTAQSVEGVLQFIVDNYKPASGGGGSTISVKVGKTTTTDPGSQASVTNSGTATDLVLDFSIPRGVAGLQGKPGAPGQGVPVGGTTGQVLAKKSDSDYDTQWVADKTSAG